MTDTNINTIMNPEGFNNELSRVIGSTYEKTDNTFLSPKALNQWFDNWDDLGVAYGKALAALNQMANLNYHRDITFANLGKIADRRLSFSEIERLLAKTESKTKYTYLGYVNKVPRTVNMTSATTNADGYIGIGIFSNGAIILYCYASEYINYDLRNLYNLFSATYQTDAIVSSTEETSNNSLDIVDGNISRIKRRTINSISADIADYSRKIDIAKGKLKAEEDILAQLKPRLDKGIISNDVKFLHKFPQIKSIVAIDDKIIIHTNLLHLSATDQNYLDGVFAGKSVPLGEMEIVIWPERLFKNNELRECIRVNNLSNMNNPMAHPHIRNSQCFDQWEDRLHASRNNVNLVDIVDTLLNFLSTFTPQDEWGYTGIESFDPDGVFGNVRAIVRGEEGEEDEDGNWMPYYEYDNGEYLNGEFIFYDEGENCEYWEPEGRLVLFREGQNGEWLEEGWRFYEEEYNGVFTADGFEWYEDGVNGYWDQYNEHFTFYRDDPEWEQDANGTWFNTTEIEETETENATEMEIA